MPADALELGDALSYISLVKLADFPEVAALSAEEKIVLLDELWTSIGSEIQRSEVTDEEKRLLDDRWERYLQDPSMALSDQEFRAKIEALRR